MDNSFERRNTNDPSLNTNDWFAQQMYAQNPPPNAQSQHYMNVNNEYYAHYNQGQAGQPTGPGYVSTQESGHQSTQQFGYQPASAAPSYNYGYNDYSKLQSVQHEDNNTEIQPPLAKMDNFLCGCCQDLLIEPTTLTCGHSFCRLCLAQWFLKSKKTKCMVCQCNWSELPQVSYTLRSTIMSTFPDHYQNRVRNTDPLECDRMISQFESQVSTLNRPKVILDTANRVAGSGGNVKAFILGIIVALLIWLIFRYLGWKDETLASKPVLKWSKEDCLQWLEELGLWTQDRLAHEFERKDIDGHILLALANPNSVTQLDEMLQDTEEENKQLFIYAVMYLSATGYSPPHDLWDYKNLHFGKVVWLQTSIAQFPRLTVFYLYLFDYEASYLPLIHAVSPGPDHLVEVTKYTVYYPEPTWGQTLSFISKTLLLPYLSVYNKFTLDHIWYTNTRAALFLSLRFWIGTIAELIILYNVFIKERVRLVGKRTGEFVVKVCGAYFSWGVVYLLWIFLPSFIINPIFYYGFFVQPILDMFIIIKLVKGIVQTQA